MNKTKIDSQVPVYFNLNSCWLYHVYGRNKMGLTAKYKTGGVLYIHIVYISRGANPNHGTKITKEFCIARESLATIFLV
jgi:hypothetical protein